MRRYRIAIASILLVCVAMFAVATGQQASEGGEPVTLKTYFPGDRPDAWDAVMAEAYERLDAAGLSYRIDANFVPWGGELDQKRQIALAAGEDYDMVFDAPWSTMEEMIDAGHYRDLEPLLNEHGPNILAARPQQMWDANRFHGVIYGIPLGAENVGGRGYVIRRDLREKYGMGEITTFDQLIDYLYEVKQNEPDLIPINTKRLGFVEERFYPVSHTASEAPGQTLYRDFDGDPTKIINTFDNPPEWLMETLELTRQLYIDGIIDPDVLATTNGQDEFTAGRTAAAVVNGLGVNASWHEQLRAIYPEAELEFITFVDLEWKRPITFQQFNFATIPIYSDNEVDVIKFLNWAHIKENYDLLTYGIEGETWEPVGDNQFRYVDEGYRWFPYAWIWNPTHHRLDADLPDEIVALKEWDADADNYSRDVLTGLTWDTDPYQDENSQLESLATEFFEPLRHGVVDVDEWWTEFRDRAYDFAEVVREAKQRQIEAVLASQ